MEAEQDIFAAIAAGDKDRVAKLIAADQGVAHSRNQAGVSALMQARYSNQMEMVALLRGSAGELDVFEAAALGDVTRLRALLASDKALLNGRSGDGFTPLHLACFFGQPEAVQVLISNGADVNATSPARIAVIHSAAASRNADIVRLVLQAGADPNVQQQRGYTALHEAAMHNSVERAQALLDAGADRSIRNDDGQTALEMAVQNGNKEVTELLSAKA
jgi:ankyrin repeat protein